MYFFKSYIYMKKPARVSQLMLAEYETKLKKPKSYSIMQYVLLKVLHTKLVVCLNLAVWGFDVDV